MGKQSVRIALVLGCLSVGSCATSVPPATHSQSTAAPAAAPVAAPPTDTDVLRAARAGRAADLRDLLRRGGNANARTSTGIPALWYAIDSKSADTVSVLLQNSPELANRQYRLTPQNALHPPMVDALVLKLPAIEQVLIDAGARIDWTSDKGEGLLELAAFSGDVDSLKVLTKASADPKKPLQRHATLLQLAALEGQSAMVGALLDDGLSANARDDFGTSSLQLAVDGGHIDTVRMLLDRGAWAYTRDTYGETALSTAKRRIKDPTQQSAMMNLLIEHGAPANGKNRPVDDAYLDAVRRGDLAAVKKAVNDGADIDARTVPAPYAPVSAASVLAVAHPDVLAYLLDRGINIYACNDYEFSAIHSAASRGGALASVELLVKHGADINQKAKTGATPLSMAVRDNLPSMVKGLLGLGADATVRDIGGLNLLASAREEHHSKLLAPMLIAAGAKEDPPGTPQPCVVKGDETPACSLPLLISNGNSSRVQKAIEGGIDINTQGPARRSYLMLALALPKARDDLPPTVLQLSPDQIGRRIALARYLIDHGINLKAVDEKGLTALHFAAADARVADIIQPLLAKGADPNAHSAMPDSTPLLIAVQNGNTVAVERLLQGGARADEAGEKGLTPLKLAVNASRADLMNLLLAAGAKPDFDAGVAPSPRQLSRGKSPEIQKLLTP